MFRTSVQSFAVAAVAIFGAVAAPAWASVIVSPEAYTSTGFTVSSTDLIEGLTPTAISGTNDQESLSSNTTGTGLTDGTFGAANPHSANNPTLTIFNNNASVTYSFSSPTSIGEIDTYSGWQDAGRSRQDYTVSISTNNGANYTTLASVASAAGSSAPSDGMVAITDSTGTLATGITNIKFDFPSTQNGYVGYTEIDALAPTPEPASLSLIGLGSLGLLLRRRA